MVQADESAPHGAPLASEHLTVDRAELGAARRQRTGRADDHQDWTACAMPSQHLVVAADGSLHGCAFGARGLAIEADATLADAWSGPEFATLRGELAAARVPCEHCRGCVRWLRNGLLSSSPMVHYGAGPGLVGASPTTLTLRLPAPTTPWPAARQRLALAAAAVAEHVVIEADEPLAHPFVADVLAVVRARSPRPAVRLRGRHFAAELPTTWPAETMAEALIVAIEVVADDLDAELAPAAQLAKMLGAKCSAHCLLGPGNWHVFEDLARACADHTVALELRLLAHDGQVPLAELDVDDLRLVKDVVVSTWSRFGGDHQPSSLAPRAFDDLCAELRAMLRERTERELGPGGTTTSSPARVAASLPGLAHPWLADAARADWWLTNLLGHGHLPVVRDWLMTQIGRERGEAALRSTPWLRVLCQRLACERPQAPLLELLRAVYGESKGRARLVADDAAFAHRIDLKPFGGPWADRLGLAQERPRKRPFALGKPRAAKANAAPVDVTVLIPSYRHGEYIEETIRSVLAQRHGNFKLLVVDDCSPDDTVARARSIADPRVEVRVNASNVGLGNSVLQALATIDTPFVALLNSDDLFHPDRLTRCLEVLDHDPSVQLVTTGMHLVDQRGGELTPANASLVLDGKQVFDWVHWYAHATPATDLPAGELFSALLERNFLATSSNLVCRTDWLRAQATSLQSLKYCLDWQLFLEAALAGALHHLHEPLVAYRLHATNTVWFREGRRWSYYLEVNRVAAAALREFVRRNDGGDEAEVARVLEAVAGHVARNRETDGLALFLNTIFDALQLDRLAANSPRVQELVQRLNTTAENVRVALDRAAVRDPIDEDRRTQQRVLLGQLADEQTQLERGHRRWLQTYVDSLEERLRDCWDGRHQLEQDKQALYGQIQELHDRLTATTQAAAAERSRLAADLQQVQQRANELEARCLVLQRDLDAARQSLGLVEDLRRLIDGDLQALRREREELRAQVARITATSEELAHERVRLNSALDAERAEVGALKADRDHLQTSLATARTTHEQLEQRSTAELAAARVQAETERENARAHAAAELAASRAQAAAELESTRQRLRAEAAALEAQRNAEAGERARLASALANEQVQVAGLHDTKHRLEAQRDTLTDELGRARGELESLRRSREFRAGNFLWNKMPLGYLSRRGKKWYRRLVDAKNRAMMMLRSSRKADGVAVVCACWHWPIYSHTFVYQEMIGLTHMGLDVRMFHWELGDTAQLHKAFSYLADHRTQLQPVWENHLRDKEHFEKTRPGKLRSFLELVAARTGRKVEELEKEPLVLQGCTFARMAELAGATYLHSYFFYDQTFMAMQAAWLLDLPRGVSCYADHMLDDYPFKLVGLHVELASVVVATSARIKTELSAKSGGKFDDKIIVKPNGVDGARFPAIVRGPRQPKDAFEVVSISRIEPKKGLTHLVEAVADLKKRGHKVVVHVIGSKDPHSKGSLEYAAEFEQRIRDLGVDQEFVLHGMKKQEELPPILQRCRAFVAPYVEVANGDKDGIPTAMLEGLASGLPVVTTNSGSILEVVDHDVEGIVVKQRDSVGLANALERLIVDPALERRMAKAARARFDRDFDIRVTEQRLHARVAALVKTQQQKPKR